MGFLDHDGSVRVSDVKRPQSLSLRSLSMFFFDCAPSLCAGEIEVVDLSILGDSKGNIVVAGNILNTLGKAITNVNIAAAFYYEDKLMGSE